ncbi:MAG: NAD-glutamate dehydrogenase [Myxococcales bacterium]|nr:NAD-glutamate dehydrogenase [Myxococcales bacterium]
MPTQKLSSQRIREVQKVLTAYTPTLPGTDLGLLTALSKAVLASVDVRDLRRVSSEELVANFESLLATIRERGHGEICVALREVGGRWVIESCMEDQPFLVSSVRAWLAASGLKASSVVNAVVKIRRDAGGVITSVGTGPSESIIRIVLDFDGAPPADLKERYCERLRLAQAMVRDFQPMRRRLQDLADDYLRASVAVEPERAMIFRETEGIIRWLCEENFVLLAVEEFDMAGQMISNLGIASVVDPGRDAERMAAFAAEGERTVRYRRSNDESPVHRAGRPGHFIITRIERDGTPIGTCLINGLFTYRALHTPPEEIPHLRVVLRGMLVDRNVSVDSHRGKSITNAFNSLPLEFMLTEPQESIWELTDRVLRAEAEGESDVHIRIGEDRQSIFAFISLPREQFSEELRLQVQELLMRECGATYADFGVYMDRYDNAIIHYYLTGPGAFGEIDTEKLRTQVLALAKSWNERLREALNELVGADEAESLFEIYQDAFIEEHKRRAGDLRLLGDLACLENLRRGADFDCDLFISTTGDHPGSLNLRVFRRQPLGLSEELPLITSFGLRVIDEYVRPVHVLHHPPFEMDNFRLDVRPERIPALMARAEEFRAAMREVYAGSLGRDSLNQLVIKTSMTALEVEILRAYVAYIHQIRSPFTTGLIRQVLTHHPTVTQALLAWLSARFDPALAGDAAAERATEETLAAELRDVSDYTADRVLQTVAAVVRATRRTNAFIAKRGEGAALAFKLDGAQIPFGPEPKPWREIWVYHREFEGVHLRGGRVARGGLRFSDRPDDFRTEIHGLMATQMVKNVLIVPMGAKGGFVLRDAPSGRDALRAAGDRIYQVFITALLSVTDNVVAGKPATPDGIMVYGEEKDPYLVVAADKGTAHLSDTANSISMAHGFWLDDAFASGGSNGYDHKATGITARGAWETTKRCFRELGLDPEEDVITAVGVGDMSGDVFGNGLLRSRTIKLLAAFNHAHIFIDPNPAPEASFRERERLFELPRSQWSDYDPTLISKGGGVYSRNSKKVDLSSEARHLLGFGDDQTVSGEDVIRAILQLPVDLLWMGGIGTYIKSRDESHADVGDKANDFVRINASELRCRVLAEGANLAITDQGRVDFARAGGLNYTSYLDNSGGVDTSDHEVNIKILFAPLLASEAVSREARNEILRRCTDEVCEMVLENNRSQSRMVSFDCRRSLRDIFRYSRTLNYLTQEVPFNPESFAMPSEDELEQRSRKGLGLYKCEASALCAHGKMLAYRQLLESRPLSEALVARLVRDYFPPAIAEVAGEAAVAGHLLRREIATTMAVNQIIDNAGATFFPELLTGTGRSAAAIAEAYFSALDAGDIPTIQRALYAIEDKHRQGAIYAAMERIQGAIEDATYFLLEGAEQMAMPADGIDQARRLLEHVETLLPVSQRPILARQIAELEKEGIPSELADKIARLEHLPAILESVAMAGDTGRSPREVLRLRLEIARAMNLGRLQEALAHMVYRSRWEGPAAQALSRHLNAHLRTMVRAVEGDDVAAMIQRLHLDAVRQQGAASLEGGVSIAGIVMFDHHLRRLLAARA